LNPKGTLRPRLRIARPSHYALLERPRTVEIPDHSELRFAMQILLDAFFAWAVPPQSLKFHCFGPRVTRFSSLRQHCYFGRPYEEPSNSNRVVRLYLQSPVCRPKKRERAMSPRSPLAPRMFPVRHSSPLVNNSSRLLTQMVFRSDVRPPVF